MNIHTRLHDREVSNSRRDPSPRHQHGQGGLWKLLAAAAIILLGLIVAMEFFGDGTSHFTAASGPQTIVE